MECGGSVMVLVRQGLLRWVFSKFFLFFLKKDLDPHMEVVVLCRLVSSTCLCLQAKKKKVSPPEKPAKKPKTGESSKPGGSSRSGGGAEDNMFQVSVEPQVFL